MECPILGGIQNNQKGQHRLNQSIEKLGEGVVLKIIVFSLYTLGYPIEYISRNIKYSNSGTKKIIREILKHGVDRFLDKRKKSQPQYLIKSDTESPIDFSNKAVLEMVSEDDSFLEYKISGMVSFKIKKNDDLLKKIFVLLCLDSHLLTQIEAAKLLGCKNNSISNNFSKYKSLGTKGLIDLRSGQKNDYKFSPEVKCEIVKKYMLSIISSTTPTKTTVSNHLNEKFSKKHSERAVALHLKKIGLTDNKKETISEIICHINNRIDSFEYVNIGNGKPYPMMHIAVMKKIQEELTEPILLENSQENIFHIEQKVELVQKSLQPVILESIVTELQRELYSCPNCGSTKSYNIANNKKIVEKPFNTSLGSDFILSNEMRNERMCAICKTKYCLSENMLKLPAKFKYTPLSLKKICSSNRAGSYENGVKNLKELTNIEVNKNQVRLISNHVGEYITKEFENLHKDIIDGLGSHKIRQRHPLIEKLSLNKKYFDKSRYLIVFAIDGGRMQLFDWIPQTNENKKAKKKLRWHENKVFRISIYDKAKTEEVGNNIIQSESNRKYKSAQIIAGLTTYGATNASWKETAPQILSHLYMRGIDTDDVDVCISDGSEHILNVIFQPLFPESTHILDYYHKIEALYSCLKSIDTEQNMVDKFKSYLWEGRISMLIKKLKEIQLQIGTPSEGKRNPENPKVKLDNLINHFSRNKNRLEYNHYRKEGYPIGSGCIESAVKLFGKRIKGTEKQWNDNGGEAILNLYSFLLSEDERWDKLWQFLTPWLEC